MVIRSLSNAFSFTFFKILLNFSSNILLAKIINDPSIFGIILYSLNIVDLCVIFLSLGLNGSLVRYSESLIQRNKLRPILSAIFTLVLLLYLIFFTVILTRSSFVLNLININSVDYLIFIVIYLPFRLCRQILFSLFWGLNDFRLRGLTEFWFALFNCFIFLIIYFVDFEVPILFLFMSYIIADLVSFLISDFVAKGKFDVGFGINLDYKLYFSFDFIELMKYGFWTFFGAISLVLFNFADRFFINYFFDSVSLGKYLVIFNLIAYISMVGAISSNVLLSLNIRKKESSKRIKFVSLFKEFILVLSSQYAIYLLFYFFLDIYIENLYGFNYSGLEWIYPYFVLYPFFQTLYFSLGNICSIFSVPKFSSIALLIGLLSNIVFIYFFIPLFGFIVIPLSFTFSYLIISLLIIVFLKWKRVFNIK